MAATETSATSGIDATPTANPTINAPAPADDPFAGQREGGDDPFAGDKLKDVAGSDEMGDLSSSPPTSKRDKRADSEQWDASKVPPSQFQKRKGSIYATPSSRDGHAGGSKERDKAYHEKLKEKGWSLFGKK